MSTKRKIEDYKDQKVAIHCSTKEEWDKIVDLFPSNRSVKKNYWQEKANNGKSDTINRDGYGWSPKKYYEDEGYTIYPASDFLEEESFKFNIGDEIKAKPGGYYISDPKFFVESHKISLPSSKSGISGKIIERTQAQGFNWYRCRYGGNWITEEGVELVKEFENGQREQPFKNLVEPSTKEAFDLQNKSKNMNEDIFSIELNSQKELDAIMDFYKQKGFKEIGDSHDYRNNYVVFINMKDKKWQTSVCNDLDYPVKTLSELGIEVKSKSLVGRYLKALVDYPNGGSVLKGEIGIITKEYNGIPSEVHFPSQNYYVINSTTYKNGESYELMPEGFKLEDVLISEAKKRYPLGTKFRPAHILSNTSEYCIVTEDSIFEKHEDQIVLTVNGLWWIDRGNLKYGNTGYDRYVYYKGKWAEIVSDEPEINTYSLKVGDTLKQEIINAWAYFQGNFCPDVQTGWVDVFCGYGQDRKIEDFRDIDGQIGFHVSGCAKGTHYLKAEGFKEFADNFYKKEVKSWIQEQDEMLNVIIKQHPLTPKECYPSNEIIIPQVIKAQKTIQNITIESPTELDLKLKTIKPKQIQTIKI